MKLNLVTYQVNLPAYQIYSLWKVLLMSSRCTGRTVKCLLHSIKVRHGGGTVSELKWCVSALSLVTDGILFDERVANCIWDISSFLSEIDIELCFFPFFLFVVFLTIQLTGIENIFNIITGIFVTYYFINCFLLRHSVPYFSPFYPFILVLR